ncbi:MAG: extracellular solute-binding protein [Treponema sp.]|jgi:putative aldouronate transport system substrate-binding protein|nr:extracellular solute-binding protein [Treponema sp.]
MKGSKKLMRIAPVFFCAVLVLACGGAKPSGGGKTAFNETGYPIVNEPVTLKVIASKSTVSNDYPDLPLFQEIEKKTGVKVDWQYTGVDWATQKPLILASNDLPDVFFGRNAVTEGDVISNMGLFVQLDDLIEKYGVNVKAMFQKQPSMLSFSRAYDGHIYGLPQQMARRPATYSVYGINQNWLDKLGLKLPATTEEFYTVLKAFKTKDPNGNGLADEIPWTFRGGDDGIAGFADMLCAFGIANNINGDWLSVTDGKVQYIAAQEGFQDAIAYLRRLYAEGLIDQEVFTQDWNQFTAKTHQADPEIVGVGPHWSRNAAFDDRGDEHYSLLMPLKGPKGHQGWRTNPEFVKGAKYVFEITSSCKNPEIAFRWGDAFYDEMAGLQMYAGYVGVRLKDNGDGTYIAMPPPAGTNDDDWMWRNGMNDLMVGFVSDELSARFEDPIFDRQYLDKERLSAYFPKEYYPLVSFTPDELNELSTLRQDIHTFAQQQTANWVVNGGIENEYAGFIRQLETMGLNRMVEIYQGAYNRYTGK